VEGRRNKGIHGEGMGLKQHKLAGMMSLRTFPEVVSLSGFSKCFVV